MKTKHSILDVRVYEREWLYDSRFQSVAFMMSVILLIMMLVFSLALKGISNIFLIVSH